MLGRWIREANASCENTKTWVQVPKIHDKKKKNLSWALISALAERNIETGESLKFILQSAEHLSFRFSEEALSQRKENGEQTKKDMQFWTWTSHLHIHVHTHIHICKHTYMTTHTETISHIYSKHTVLNTTSKNIYV